MSCEAMNAMRRSTSLVIAGVSALVVGGCATTGMSGEQTLKAIELALGDQATLRAAADEGDALAELGLAIVLQNGLHGVEIDREAAAGWRMRAVTSRGSMPITQYTAAFKGQPSRVNVVYVPRYDVHPVQLRAVDACVAVLNGESMERACGSEAQTASMVTAWRAAKGR